jgi:AcrR family transcriptional regulator
VSTRASSAVEQSPAKRRNTRPEKTIRKLLDATIEELRESAFLDLTVRGVASRAGVSPASAYKYFPSKGALVADAYLRMLQDVPMFIDVNQSAYERVSATLREMAFVGADHPEIAAACANALISDDPGVEPARVKIATEVGQRISAALGPGWPREVVTIIQMTFNGGLITAKGGHLSYPQIAEHFDEAVRLILGAPKTSP